MASTSTFVAFITIVMRLVTFTVFTITLRGCQKNGGGGDSRLRPRSCRGHRGVWFASWNPLIRAVLESFAPCHLQSFLLADFKKTILFFGFKNTCKKSVKQELESVHEKHFVERNNKVENWTKTRVYAQKPRKMPFNNSISG
jgi:hypothetical protein